MNSKRPRILSFGKDFPEHAAQMAIENSLVLAERRQQGGKRVTLLGPGDVGKRGKVS